MSVLLCRTKSRRPQLKCHDNVGVLRKVNGRLLIRKYKNYRLGEMGQHPREKNQLCESKWEYVGAIFPGWPELRNLEDIEING